MIGWYMCINDWWKLVIYTGFMYWDQGMNDTMSSLFEFGYLPNFIQHVCSRQEFIGALIAGESCDRINEMIAGYQTVTF